MKYITPIFRFFTEANVKKTIAFNFRHLPFKEALRLPIHLFGKVDLCEEQRGGVIEFSSQNGIHFGAWKIGQETGLPFGKRNSHHDVTYISLEGKLVLGEYGVFQNGCVLCIREKATVTLGSGFWMGHAGRIISMEQITIEPNCQFSWECQVFDSDFHYISDVDGNIQRFTKPTYIGNNSWIGNRVTFGKGARIGDWSIVAGYSLVNKDFGVEAHCVYGGVPARLLKKGYSRVWYDKQGEVDKWFEEHPQQEICNINWLNN